MPARFRVLLLSTVFATIATGALAAEVTDIKTPDLPLGTVTYPNGKSMTLSVGFGSGAFHRPGDPATSIFTITDRGPNIDCTADAPDLIGLDKDALCMGNGAAKIFPRPDFVPTIYELSMGEDGAAKIVSEMPLKGSDGKKLNGLSNPLVTTTTEGAYTSDGKEIAKSPDGFDSEALVRLKDGSFFIADEYGASIAHVAADGTVLKRLVPAGLEGDYAGAAYPVEGKLPAIVMKRFLNRGIESIAVSPDEAFLYFAVQSPLANPDNDAYKNGTVIRLFKFDRVAEKVVGEYAYPLDDPKSFAKDNEKKPAKQSDVKISELAAVGPDQLIVLERIAKTTKLYRVDLAAAKPLPASFDDAATSPSLETLPADGRAAAGVEPLKKHLVLDSDTLKDMPAKIEGMAVIDGQTLILTSDNDFGIAGDKSRIVRVTLDEPLTD